MDPMKELEKLTIRKTLSRREQVLLDPLSASKPLSQEQVTLLAEQSIRDGEQRYTEADIRALVGAPDADHSQFDKEGFCVFCGDHESKGYHYKCWR